MYLLLGRFCLLLIQVLSVCCTEAYSSLTAEVLLLVLRCYRSKIHHLLPFTKQRQGLRPPPSSSSTPSQAPARDALVCQTRGDASHKFHKNESQRLKITKPRPSQTNALSARQERSW